MTADNLFSLEPGETMPRRLLYDMIQFSKQPGSAYWGGPESQIGNTPQQGINWIGRPPAVRGVIIKTKLGSYAGDGWLDEISMTRHPPGARRGTNKPPARSAPAWSLSPWRVFSRNG